MPTLDLLLLLFLFLLNGFFAMSELAVVSSRRGRLQAMVDERRAGARRALALLENPGAFLSSVQVGITLVGITAGAIGGSHLSGTATEALIAAGLAADIADWLGPVLVVAGITYGSLIIGELVPKQIALTEPERIARWVAPPMTWLSRLTWPLVWFLERSTRFCLWLIRVRPRQRDAVSEEEIKLLIADATEAGVVKRKEQDILGRVMTFVDASLPAVMTPSREVVAIDVSMDKAALLNLLRDHDHNQFPLVRDDMDHLEGLILARDLARQLLAGEPLDLLAIRRKPLVIFEGTSPTVTLEKLRQAEVPVAFVVDEYGHLEGMVTASDILAALTGDLADTDNHEPNAIRREDGSWLLRGGLPLTELPEYLPGADFPEGSDYHTLAGLLLEQLKRLPREGEVIAMGDYRFEVVDMDGYRIDKVLAASTGGAPPED